MSVENIVEQIYKQQESEIRSDIVNTNWTNVIDREEEWILENCPDLYIIEKASNDLQKKITRINVEKDIITAIIERLKSNVVEVGPNAIRIVYHGRDFEHSGVITGPVAGLNDSARNYNSNLNHLAMQIHKSIVDDFENDNIKHNKHFLMLLSLSFGSGEGGHFGLILGSLDTATKEIKVSVVDPYDYYTVTFQFLIREAFNRLQDYTYNPATGKVVPNTVAGRTPVFSRYRLQVENPITTSYLESGSRNPAQIGTLPRSTKDKYAVQSYWGQDHFCFMWCVFFAHNYIVNKDINKSRDLYNEINANQNINLVIIKTYILQLFTALDANVGSLYRDFFKYVWTCYTQKGLGPQPPQDQITNAPSKYPPFATHEILYTVNPAFLINPTVAGLQIAGLNVSSLPILEIELAPGQIIMCSNMVATKTTILQHIPANIIADKNLVPQNSVFQLLHYYYNNKGGFVNTDLIYQQYTDQQGLFTTIDCSTATPEAIEDQIVTLNLGPKMSKSRTISKCDRANIAMSERNAIYQKQTSTINCVYDAQRIMLHDYQKKAVERMIFKATHPGVPGLLVWFGTGTGKTLTANTVAKITTTCNQYFRKCFIISTKSVYKAFATSLSELSDLTPDQLLPQPFINTDQDSAYFARHNTLPKGTSDIYVFSATRFMDILRDPATGEVKPDWINVLQSSLLIIDEAHKVVNVENKVEGEYRFFSSCCRNAKQVMLLTATPMVNSACDIEPLLALIDRRAPMTKREFKHDYIGIINVTSVVADICPALPAGQAEVVEITNCIFDLTANTTYTSNPTYAWNSVEGRARLSDRIIYSMPVGALPKYIERKFCVSTNDPALITALRGRQTIEVDNITTGQVSSFGSGEFLEPRYRIIKCQKLLEIIKQRETTPRGSLITTPFNPFGLFDPSNLRFKYVIYSQLKSFLVHLKKHFITSGIDKGVISEITGDTSADNRQKAMEGYNSGKIKILLITDAAVEGVDLRRTGMVILAEPVWTKAKYDQIIGRGVRDSSGLRLKPADLRKVETVLNQAFTLESSKPMANMAQITTEFDEINTALSEFTKDNIGLMVALLKTGNRFGPYIKDKLDFSEIPDTVDCMTFVLSYSIIIGGGPNTPPINKYSIDTYKYNAMRVKYTEMLTFFNSTLNNVIIR